MGGLKTWSCCLGEFLEQTRAGQVSGTVPLRLGAPEMLRLELPRDPGTWVWVFRCGGLEGKEDLPNRFPEVVEPPVVPSINKPS